MKLQTAISIGFALVGAAGGLAAGTAIARNFYATPIQAPSPTPLPPGHIIIDPAHTVCFMFDMKPAGWALGTERKRADIGDLVRRGKVDWTEAQTLTCYQKNAPGVADGKPFTLRQEWYHWRRYR